MHLYHLIQIYQGEKNLLTEINYHYMVFSSAIFPLIVYSLLLIVSVIQE